MRPMEKQSLVTDLIEFLTTDSASRETMACLSSNAEVGIRVAQNVDVSVSYDGEKVVAVEKELKAPDFIFHASPEAIQVLISEKGLSPAQLGIKLVKQVIGRDIKLSMPSSAFQITRKGYLKIIALGGTEFLTELKKHNLASIPKITAALRRLRKN